MTSDYLRLVPRTEQAARTGEKPVFAPSRLAEPEKPIPRVREDRRFRDLERSKSPASWENVIVEGLAWAFVMGVIIVLSHL